jgi:hypothetical protein
VQFPPNCLKKGTLSTGERAETCTINQVETMQTAIYARVSTIDQNCELQLGELRRRPPRLGAGEGILDAGFSGANASRPALDQLMASAARPEFDCVLVWKIDRFGRSVLHLSQQLAALASYGVRFMSVSQAIDTDASNPSSRLLKPDSVTAKACAIAKKAGLRDTSIHTLRHSHGSQLLSAGAPIPTVSKRLGHSSPYVTATIYSRR